MTTTNMSIFKIRSFSHRLINFLRPKPRFMPLSVDQVLKNKDSLDTVNRFNDFYYMSGVAGDLNWQGLQMIKNPCDLWMSLLLFQKLKPTAIIETGTHHGGSATFYADMLKALGIDCEVITIDINPKWHFNPADKNIHSLIGYSTDENIVAKTHEIVKNAQKRRSGHVMLYLDSDHSQDNVFKEMNLYSDLVTPGSYMVVEDTNVNGHPSGADHGPGPFEAVEQFLKTNDNFRIDKNCEKFLLTFNPSGWLIKK